VPFLINSVGSKSKLTSSFTSLITFSSGVSSASALPPGHHRWSGKNVV